VFIVEQRPWLGIWLTEYVFSGIRGEATKRIGERCLDYATNGFAWGALGGVGGKWIGWLAMTTASCKINCDDTHYRGIEEDWETDAQSHILHFKEHAAFLLLPPLCGKPRRIKTRLFALVCLMMSGQTDMSSIVHSADKTSQRQDLFFYDSQDHKDGRKETGG
jgi:hypothetical protein